MKTKDLEAASSTPKSATKRIRFIDENLKETLRIEVAKKTHCLLLKCGCSEINHGQG